MLLEAFLDVFGANFGALALILAPSISNKCKKHAKYFCCRLGTPASKLLGAAVTAVGVFDNSNCNNSSTKEV